MNECSLLFNCFLCLKYSVFIVTRWWLIWILNNSKRSFLTTLREQPATCLHSPYFQSFYHLSNILLVYLNTFSPHPHSLFTSESPGPRTSPGIHQAHVCYVKKYHTRYHLEGITQLYVNGRIQCRTLSYSGSNPRPAPPPPPIGVLPV